VLGALFKFFSRLLFLRASFGFLLLALFPVVVFAVVDALPLLFMCLFSLALYGGNGIRSLSVMAPMV